MFDLDNKTISNIRVLTMEMITKAKSGHPGIALGAAPILHTLYSRILKVTANNSTWFNRDRFILSAGHGSSLLYVLLHLSGYDISLDDLKNFRQLGSKTPGHPEVGYVDGVDATSGPLGQGIAMSVGMAISQQFLAQRYNKEGLEIFNHYVYVLCSDGELQEGIAMEALSLAGHLHLNKLIFLFDSNDIQLDGKVSNANTENIKMKIEAMNLNYLRVEDGENIDDIEDKIKQAQKSNKPSFIEVKTIIGKTAKGENTANVHGSPLSEEEVLEMRKKIGGSPFEVFSDVKKFYENIIENKNNVYIEEEKLLQEYQNKYPAEYMEMMMFLEDKDLITKEDLQMPFDPEYKKATRNAIGEVLNRLSSIVPNLLGGSADLTKSTNVKGLDGDFSYENYGGRNINFGVREHSMAAICNGICLNKITSAFCGGFLVFSDYMKPAIRMSALMKLPVIYCFTHDSIAVGEDGPTHQPIEQLTMLRSIPGLNVIRPCGKEEAKEALLIAYNSKENPTAIILTRQALKETRTKENAEENMTLKGAYIIKKEPGVLQGILLATGSEVDLACNAQIELEKEGISVRVVSMPSMYLFDKQSQEYKDSILPKNIYTLGIEMSEGAHLYRYVRNGSVRCINEFGRSGKLNDVIESFGFNTNSIVQEVKNSLK